MDGFTPQKRYQKYPRAASVLLSADASRDTSEQKETRLYIPDEDVVVLKNGVEPRNGATGIRTSEGAKIYLPDDELIVGAVVNGAEQEQPAEDSLILKGIPFEELIMKEEVTFNGMNSNNHVQIDKQTWGKPKQTVGRPVAMKHLFRYFTDICVDCWLSTVDPVDFLLSCNYTKSDIARMDESFARFSSLDVKSHLSPHVRFIVRTLGAGTGDICDGQECGIDGTDFVPHNCQVSYLGKSAVPPLFFGKRLEKTIGPRHAYLVHYGLPHGKTLLEDNGRLFQEFLDSCDKPASVFAHLCNCWSLATRDGGPFTAKVLHTPDMVEALERSFHAGLLPAVQNRHTCDLDLIGCAPGRMVDLLLEHGANAIEHDSFGTSLLHWAAGSGSLIGAKALLKFLVEAGEATDAAELLINAHGAKGGATPLHFASCGVANGKFGVGGHANVCRLFLDAAGDRASELANVECFNGNTPLMWAAWSGSLDVVKLLVESGANPQKENCNQHNAAQWAAAGGHLDVYEYFRDELGVES